MVGQKVSQQPVNDGAHPSGSSKFRRTLSHGLSFISNPLSQRRTTPGRQPAHNSVLAVATPAASTLVHKHDAMPSPTRNTAFVEAYNASTASTQNLASHESPIKNLDVEVTSKALPRSRTTSCLPRPVKSEPDVSASELERTTTLQSLAVVTDLQRRATTSKIPTPSPPPSEGRVSSPRRYIPHNTLLHPTHAVTGHSFAGNDVSSLSKAAFRSRTTSSLVKLANSPQPSSFMTPRNMESKRPASFLHARNSNLQENIPTNSRLIQRRSQLQERDLRRESLAVATTTPNRKSLLQSTSFTHGKQLIQSSPLTAKKRLSSNLSQQTPVTVKRVSDQLHENTESVPKSIPVVSGSIAQPRMMGLRHPSTPTPLPTDATRAKLPHLNIDKDLQRKTLGTPNGLGGVWRSSRAMAAANHEVRRLPRSSTFHNFGGNWEDVPPIPPIPERYRTPSFSSFFESSLAPLGITSKPCHFRMVSDAHSCESIPEEPGEGTHPMESVTSSQPVQSQSTAFRLSESSVDFTALPPLPRQLLSTPSPPPTHSETSVPSSQNGRPWSISERQYEDNADIETYLQVRDYMPPLYWAGRFQSRYDQWRTEAMMAELDPKHRPEGQLGQCKLHEEKSAACYIFAQLRDLCLTGQAADSLWVRDT
jgi:hypothetical protein